MRKPRRILFILLLAVLIGVPSTNAYSVNAAITVPAELSITDSGFVPAVISVAVGQPVHWTNDSVDVQSVIADSGLFDSGPLASGAGFSLSIPSPGVYTYRSAQSPGFVGEVHVVMDLLEGPSADPANSNIPDITFPVQTGDDISEYPLYGFRASRTRILLGFTDDATVAEANAAIQSAGVTIIGGLPEIDTLLVAVDDTPDFAALDAAIEILRADPAVDFATTSSMLKTSVLPQPAESARASGGPLTWEWDVLYGPDDEPLGAGGNWGHEDARFPQAWNLLEEIQRRGALEAVVTGVIDSGFIEHEDIDDLVLEVICKPLPGGGEKCSSTEPDDHGLAVAGVIGATYDNDSDEDGRSLGVSGANPVARMIGVNARAESPDSPGADTIEFMVELIKQYPDVRVINFSMGLDLKWLQRDPVTKEPDASAWWAEFGAPRTCGPGPDDDQTAASTQLCTPNNEDGWLTHVANMGKLALNLAEFASENEVIIVQSAGNDGDYICVGVVQDAPGCVIERVNAENGSSLSWASRNWTSTGPNPIVIVEANNSDHELAFFSNDGGDISAPGQEVLTTGVDTANGELDPSKSIYIAPSGTSFSVPYVSALIGYMLAYDPTLTIDEIVTRLIIWGRADVGGGGQPRIDAFNAMMSIPGAVLSMVDVNDDSMDGNRRVILGEGGAQEGLDLFSSDEINSYTGDNYRTSPDGVIDMRDFRRFRDAWLQKCLETPLGEPDCAAIQSFSDVVLDGDFLDPQTPLHPKKDLNFDGCVRVLNDADCSTSETDFPRFDFNGDGQVSRFGEAIVPLMPDGGLAAIPVDATSMTDLEVLASQWDSNTANTEGWSASDLDGLMVSGDIQVNGDLFFGSGVQEISITTRRMDTGEFLPERTLRWDDPEGQLVITVPALVDVEIGVSAQANGGPLTSAPRTFNLFAGEDLRLDACADMLFLFADRRVISADGVAESELTARLVLCDGEEVEGSQVDFFQSPSGGEHGELQFSSVSTDANGEATNTFTAGTAVDSYEITARIEFPDGSDIEASLTIETEAPVKIAYRWQQTILEFSEEGSSRWGESGDPLGDCDDTVIRNYAVSPDWAPVAALILSTEMKLNGEVTFFEVLQDGVVVESYGVDPLPGETVPDGFTTIPSQVSGWNECIDHFSFDAVPLETSFPGFPPVNLTLRREGILTQTGGSVELDEFITESAISGIFEWNASNSSLPVIPNQPPPPSVHNGAGYVDIRVPADEMERYQDYVLPPTVSIQTDGDGVSLSGLSEIAELEYPYESAWTYTDMTIYDIELGVPFTVSILGDVRFALESAAIGVQQPELMFVPRGDGSALQHTNDQSQPISFHRDEFGDFQKYEYCQVVEREYTTPREYVSRFDANAGRYWERNTTYDGISASETSGSWQTEYPTQVGPGHANFVYSFVAIPYTDEAELEALVLSGEFEPPSCDEDVSLTAQFDVLPNPADEGDLVSFTDQSTTGGNSIKSWEWDFGDGGTSSEKSPTHFYSDNGEYEVTLTVTDVSGEIDIATQTVTVTNVDPNIHVGDVVVVEGQSATVTVLLSDVSGPDQQALDIEVVITGSGLAPIIATVPAGVQTFNITGLAAGSYPVTATVTDKDGGSNSDNATITVLAFGEPPPPPPPPPPPLSSCDPAITISGEEQALLDLINDYREQAGVPPLELSPALTRSARRHTFDMSSNQFADHIGSDGSTPVTRALESGYPSDIVSENLAAGLSLAIEALFGWQASPEHNQNMLNPDWDAIGIARAVSDVAYWSTEFGEVLDCGVASIAPVSEPGSALVSNGITPVGAAGEQPPLVLSSTGSGWQDRSPRLIANPGVSLSIPFAGRGSVLAQVGVGDSAPPFAAFVISDATPDERTAVTFTNRSRSAAGQPVIATLDPGDGTGPFSLGPNGSRLHTYFQDSTVTAIVIARNSEGIASVVQREVTIADVPLGPPDFNLMIAPETHVLAPDTTVNFVVSLTALNEFDSPVTLSTEPLPNGVTAQFNPPTLTPSGTSVLTIIAASDADTGLFDLNVTATGGGITHTTSSSVTLDFGLVPLCYGAFEFYVTDADTGFPIEGAQFGSFGLPQYFTDADGRFVANNIPLGNNNSPRIYQYGMSADGYWGLSPLRQITANCGVVTQANVELTTVQYASIGGQVVIGEPDPNDTSRTREVFPTDEPISDIQVFSGSNTGFTDSNGFYLFQQVSLNSNNTPRATSVQTANGSSYWVDSVPLTVEALQHYDVDLAVVPVCFTSISGTVVIESTGLPAANIPLRLIGQDLVQSTTTATTNELGEYTFPVVSLGLNNSEASRIITIASTAEYLNQNVPLEVLACGEPVEVDIELNDIQENLTTLEGRVFDVDTNEPIPGARVALFGSGTLLVTADSEGNYRFDDVLVGIEDQMSRLVSFQIFSPAATPQQYYLESASATLNANEVHVIDFGLTRQQYGVIAGTVRDAVTNLPIEGAYFLVPGNQPLPGAGATGPDGKFETDPLTLTPINLPRTQTFRTLAEGYWTHDSTAALLEAGKTTIADVTLVPICEGATISGTVVSAATGLPIQGAAIDVTSKQRVFTDANGNFVVTDVQVGTNNSPISVGVNASATGFLPQGKSVTIFCGANIVVEFGDTNSSTGTISGTITDGLTGLPLAGAFVGSEFGASTTTNALGAYTFTDVPLGVENSDREWDITAAPSGYETQTKQATAVADEVTTLDFEFSAEPNEAPVLDPVGDQSLDENDVLEVSITATDGDDDVIILSASDLPPFASFDDNGDGSGTLTISPGFDDSGVYPGIVISASDGSLSDTETITITVIDVPQLEPPTADAGGPYEVDEGAPGFSLDGSGSSDPDGGIVSYEWFVDGAVTPAYTGVSPVFDLTGDGPAQFNIMLVVTDNDGATDSSVTTVTVNNVTPLVDATGDEIDEGGTATVSATFSDPGSSDTHTASIDWGDGSAIEDLGAVTSPFDATHLYSDNGLFTVTVSITDNDGGIGQTTVDITVNNVAPTAVLANDGPVDEGSQASVSFSAQSDPSINDTAAGFIYSFDFGNDGSFEVTGSATPTELVPLSMTADGPTTIDVLGRIEDKDGGFTEYVTTVTVNNVAPAVTATGDSVTLGEQSTVSVTFTDTGAPDTHTATIHWGDGSAVEDLGAVTSPFTATHIYASDDIFTVTVTVTDDDGGEGADTASAVVTPLDLVAPVSDAGGPYSVDEGSSVALDGSGSSDSDGTIALYEWDLDEDGVFGETGAEAANGDETGATPTFGAFALDGPSSVTVSLRVTDNDGLTDLTSTQVSVTNVAPTAEASGGTFDEGSTASVGVTFTDPAPADTFSVIVDWGDGSTPDVIDPATSPLSPSHIYTDDGVFIVTVTVTDDDSGADEVTTEVTVNNIAPTAVLADDGPVDEGSQASVSFSGQSDSSSNDTAAGFIYSFDFGNDGSFEITGSAVPIELVPLSLTADGPATVDVLGRIEDKDGGFTDYVATVTINNVAPAVTATGDSVTLSEQSSVSATFDDPGAPDTHTATIDWGDGSVVENLGVVTSPFSATHTYASADTFTVTVTVTDDDGGEGIDTASAVVNAPGNEAPTADAGGPYTVDEGSSVALDGSGSSDSGGIIVLYQWDLDDDGVFGETGADAANGDETGVSPVFSVASLDGPQTFTVTLQVTDDDGLSDFASVNVLVENVAPVVEATGDAIDEGGTASVSVTFTDPALADTHTASVDWGDGSGLQDLGTVTSPFAPTHVYTDNGVFIVTVSVTDDDGGVGTTTATVTVGNVEPLADLANNGPVDEGSQGAVSFTGQSDPSSEDTAAGFIYSFDFGNDGSFEVTGSATPTALVPLSLTADGPATVDVLGRIEDKDGGFTDYVTTVTVLNVAPAVAAVGDNVAPGEEATVTASFTDPGAPDTHGAVIDWGDGSSDTIDPAVSPFDVTHTYAGSGLFTVTVTVTDDDGGEGVATTTVSVAEETGALADLWITKTGPTDPVKPGDRFYYKITIGNDGPDDAENVVITDVLPGGATLVSTSSLDCDCEFQDGVVICEIERLSAGAEITVKVKVLTDVPGDMVNTVEISSDTPDPDPDNNTASASVTVKDPHKKSADLSITKTGPSEPVSVNEEFSYLITVSNDGPSSAKNVVVTDRLPAGLTLVSTSSDSCNCEHRHGVIKCELDYLLPGSQIVVEVRVSASSAGDISNTIEISSDTSDPDLSDNRSTWVTTVVDDDPSGEGSQTISAQVDSSSDDAYDNPAGWPGYSATAVSVYSGAPGGNGPVYGGFRWDGLNIPDGAVILEAYVELTQKNWGYEVESTLALESDASPNSFSKDDSPADRWSSRTNFSVQWNPDLGAPDTVHLTPDLAAGIQELINTFGSLDSIVLLESGEGVDRGRYREWSSFDRGPQHGAKLHITYLAENVAPVVSAGPDAVSSEGSAVNLAPATFEDTSPGVFTAQIDWGDGTVAPDAVSAEDRSVSGDHVYADDGVYTVTVSVTDSGGLTGSDAFTVTVNNAAPAVNAGANQSALTGETVSLAASFTDAGVIDTHTAMVNWGDDTVTPAAIEPATGGVTATHTYSAPGLFTVEVCVTDDDGGVGCDTSLISVEEPEGDVESVSAQVSSGNDDAYDSPGGWPNFSSTSSVVLAGAPGGNGPTYGGFRWSGLNIPAGAEIVSAYVELSQSAWGYEVSTTLAFENADSPVPFGPEETPFDRWSNRTGFELEWQADLQTPGTWIATPDLAAGIQELVDSHGGVDTLTLLESGEGVNGSMYHQWSAFDGAPERAAKLHITWRMPEPDTLEWSGAEQVLFVGISPDPSNLTVVNADFDLNGDGSINRVVIETENEFVAGALFGGPGGGAFTGCADAERATDRPPGPEPPCVYGNLLKSRRG